MHRLRLLIAGMVVVALLALSGVGAAAAYPDDWYKSDSAWQEQYKLREVAKKAIAVKLAGQAVARARLMSLAGDHWPWPSGWYWRIYRQVLPVEWQGKWKEAEDGLLQLEADSELEQAKRKAADAEMNRIETLSDGEIAEHKALAAKKNGSETRGGPTPESVQPSDSRTRDVPGWGVKVPYGDDVKYRIRCKGTSTDKHETTEVPPRHAPSFKELLEQIQEMPEGCFSDENYTRQLILVPFTRSVDGKWVAGTPIVAAERKK